VRCGGADVVQFLLYGVEPQPRVVSFVSGRETKADTIEYLYHKRPAIPSLLRPLSTETVICIE